MPFPRIALGFKLHPVVIGQLFASFCSSQRQHFLYGLSLFLKGNFFNKKLKITGIILLSQGVYKKHTFYLLYILLYLFLFFVLRPCLCLQFNGTSIILCFYIFLRKKQSRGPAYVSNYGTSIILCLQNTHQD